MPLGSYRGAGGTVNLQNFSTNMNFVRTSSTSYKLT